MGEGPSRWMRGASTNPGTGMPLSLSLSIRVSVLVRMHVYMHGCEGAHACVWWVAVCVRVCVRIPACVLLPPPPPSVDLGARLSRRRARRADG